MQSNMKNVESKQSFKKTCTKLIRIYKIYDTFALGHSQSRGAQVTFAA